MLASCQHVTSHTYSITMWRCSTVCFSKGHNCELYKPMSHWSSAEALIMCFWTALMSIQMSDKSFVPQNVSRNGLKENAPLKAQTKQNSDDCNWESVSRNKYLQRLVNGRKSTRSKTCKLVSACIGSHKCLLARMRWNARRKEVWKPVTASMVVTTSLKLVKMWWTGQNELRKQFSPPRPTKLNSDSQRLLNNGFESRQLSFVFQCCGMKLLAKTSLDVSRNDVDGLQAESALLHFYAQYFL